jgi:hypothetical protein
MAKIAAVTNRITKTTTAVINPPREDCGEIGGMSKTSVEKL